MRKFSFSSLAKARARFRETFAALNERNFRVYQTGQFVSLCGTWMQNIAISWVVYRLTGSAIALGLVSFASSIPTLLFTYFGGMIADRYDRRKILIVTQWLDMIQALALTALVATGMLDVRLLVILSVFLGCVSAVEIPTRQSFVPDLVQDKNNMVNAIGVNSALFNACRMLGPLFAGVMIAVFGEVVCFAANAASYIGALISLNMLVIPRVVARAKTIGDCEEHTDPKAKADCVKANGKRSAFESEAAKGSVLQALIKDPVIRNILLLTAVTSMFGFQYATLLPVIVKEVLNGQSTMFGLLSAASGVGALAGSLAIASRGKTLALRRIVGFAELTLAFAVFVLGLSRIPALSFVAVAIAGVCLSVQLSGSNSILQLTVTPATRGRVMAIWSTFMMGFAPFAALFAGWVAERLGITWALSISSAMLLVGGILYLTHTAKTPPEETGS